MAQRPVDLAVLARFADLATDALAAAREEVDALNVYPVPDGDTGTNMYLTLSAARDALHDSAAEGREAALRAFARGALLGARGNSGVILAEMLGAIAARLAAQPDGEPTGVAIAEALRQATEASYAAVGTPVEGTILTVCRAASEAAQGRVEAEGHAGDVIRAAAAAARDALAGTPDQLPVLRDAGVVDAGGRGLVVILDAAETALTGRRPLPVLPGPAHQRTIPTVPHARHDGSEGGPAFEVMYLLDAPDEKVPGLRAALAGLGDSLVVTGRDGLWNVHVHVDDVGAAIEAGIAAGRPHRIRVTHFEQQIRESREEARSGRRVVAVAAGPGLHRLFESAGAIVVDGGPGRRPSTGQLLDAIRDCGAAEVVLLPNDHDTVRSAESAARAAETDDGIRVAVVPSHAQVQGLAAMAVHEPGRSFDRDVLEMVATARHARHGAVTVAARKAITTAGACEVGDALGVIDGDFVVVGSDLGEVAREVLGRLLGAGGELVTILSGAETGAAVLAAECREWVERLHPTVDVVVYDGGQDRYPLLMSVE
ncbi:DAK2 domain-containing protein [Nocardioides sp.]|uniref:DAK2 domain-containing protein n=1 Tax=Nocardioides sp. TaxID=35761 RepID=UPI0039E415BB